MPFASSSPFFSHAGSQRAAPSAPRPAPMAPTAPGPTSIGRTNAATPSIDPLSMRAQQLGTFQLPSQMMANPQFMALFQQYLQQFNQGALGGVLGGARKGGGFSGSLMGGAPAAPTKV